MNYYLEIIDKLNALIAEGAYEKAKDLLNNELAMPYIPKEYFEKLQYYRKLIEEHFHAEALPLSLKTIIEYLKGDARHQRSAVNALAALNLRDHYELINAFLSDQKADDEAKTTLVEALIDQESSAEYHLFKAGIEYAFIPRYIEKPTDTDAYKLAVRTFREDFFKEPAKAEMAVDLFTEHARNLLPITLDEDESRLLIAKIEDLINELFR